VSGFQYVMACLMYSKGPPFREPVYKNKLVIISILAFLAAMLYLYIV